MGRMGGGEREVVRGETDYLEEPSEEKETSRITLIDGKFVLPRNVEGHERVKLQLVTVRSCNLYQSEKREEGRGS